MNATVLDRRAPLAKTVSEETADGAARVSRLRF